MIIYLLLLLFINNSSGFVHKQIFLNRLKTPKEISFSLIDKWLQEPLNNVPHYFQIKVPFHSITDDMDNPYIRWFLQQSKLPITLSTYVPLKLPTSKTFPTHNCGNFVILSDVNDLQMAAKRFAQTAAVYFFIVNGGSVYSHMDEILDTFHFLWNEFLVYNNYLLTREGVFTYDPFAVSANKSYGKIIKFVGAYSMERALFHNMRGYPLRVQMFKSVYSQPVTEGQTASITSFKGVDGRVAYLLQQYLNFTMILQDPDPNYFGSRLPNGSFNGAIGSAINNQLDVCLTGFFVKDYLTTGISFSVAVYDDQLCIYTQKAKRISNTVSPLFSVHYKVWICFVSIAVLSSVVWFMLRTLNILLKINGDIPSRQLNKRLTGHYVDILTNTCLAWIRNTLLKYPPFANERMLVVSLCLGSVIFGAVLECSLSTIYIHPLYFPDIYTLKELDESDMEIHYRHRSIGDDLFFSDTSTLFSSLHRKLVYSNSSRILKDVVQNGNVAGVSRYKTLMLEYFNLILSKRIWIIPECPKYYTISYIWPVGAPWGDAINKLLLRFLSSGLIQKFEREMNIEVDIKIMKKRLYENRVKLKVLTLSDLQMGFYVLIFGSVVAILSFLGEIINNYALKCTHCE